MSSRNILKICLLLFICLGFSTIHAQTKKAFVKKAEEAFLTKDFHAAFTYFQNALRFDSSQTVLVYQTAQAAREFNSFTMAEKLYQQVVDQDSTNQYPDAPFWLAEMKNKLGKYREASDLYSLYMSENSGLDNYRSELARIRKESAEWSQSVADTEREDVEISSLFGAINTPYSEFGAFRSGEDIYYSSLRFEQEDEEVKGLKRLYSKILKKGSDAEAMPLEGAFSDSLTHVAHSAFNNDKTRMYFTKCQYINATDIRCDLFYTNLLEGEWSDPIKIPGGVNGDSTTSTQPTVGVDKNTEKETLYFVSDREGGLGGLDIWSAEILGDGGFGTPINIDVLNTPFDDITPFYHNESNTIYFSSNGRQGLGGYDVYKSNLYSKGFSSIKHMGSLINTSYDDVYFSLDDSGEAGLISSNREGSLYLEDAQEACCYDLYEIDFKASNIELVASTFDKLDKTPLTGAVVTLYDLSDTEADPIIIENFDSHKSTFPLDPDKEYKVVARKEGYDADSVFFNTDNIYRSQQIEHELFLYKQDLDLEIFAFDKLTGDPLIGATVTLIDLTDSLNVQTFTNPDGNDFIIPLDRDGKYKIIVSKKGYTPETLEIDATRFDDQNKVTREVYLTRGDLESFLPLIVFFDNDYPDPNSWRENVDSRYTDLFDDYYSKKDEFYEEFSAPLGESDKAIVEREYERFFEDRVLKGKVDLNSFLDILHVQLQQGEQIEIFLKGYASPISSELYNQRLGERRITNVENEIDAFQDGVLQKYIESGQLVISQESFGETTSPAGISDLANDPRNSIYSIPASSERRVEIVQIKRSDN